jgi:signal transduction histidine kinase
MLVRSELKKGVGMKILLIEDNPGDIRFLEEILVKSSTYNASMVAATTWAKAQQLLQQDSFDMVLLDLSLPDSQGIDVLQTICQDFPKLPVIVLTGMDDEHLATKVMRRGAQDYLVKGQFNETLIRRTIRYAVERKRLEYKLRIALADAQAASDAKTSFLASISHELRTPLNAILGFADVMQQSMLGPLPAAYQEYSKNIYDSGHYLLSLINDLLDLAKASVGKLELHETTIDMGHLIKKAAYMLQMQAEEKQIHIRTRFESEAQHLWADERMFTQIVINLLSNAVKFTPKLGYITVGTFLDFSQKTLGVYVQDTGIGIAQKDQRRIFEPFIQLDNPQKQSTPGTGLGLALCKHMVERHGGHLEVISAPNQGTTLQAHFPFWRGQQNFLHHKVG